MLTMAQNMCSERLQRVETKQSGKVLQITHMNELVLGVVLLATALPVAVGLVYGLRLLFALIFIQILTQVQDPPTVVLKKAHSIVSERQHRRVHPATFKKTTKINKVKTQSDLKQCSICYRSILFFASFLSYLALDPNELLPDVSQCGTTPFVID